MRTSASSRSSLTLPENSPPICSVSSTSRATASAGRTPATVPWSEDHRAAVYEELGAYEASKVESDASFKPGRWSGGESPGPSSIRPV